MEPNNSNNNTNDEKGESKKIEWRIKSPASLATAEKVCRRPRNRLQPNTKIILHDHYSSGYGWLIPGWICEEHIMESGRVYRYYYDQDATLYRSQQEVLALWREHDLIVLDL